MATIAVWSKLTGKSCIVAFALHLNGLARVFYKVTAPYGSKPGDFVTAPIKLPDDGFPSR